jgi:hypothetical protein
MQDITQEMLFKQLHTHKPQAYGTMVVLIVCCTAKKTGGCVIRVHLSRKHNQQLLQPVKYPQYAKPEHRLITRPCFKKTHVAAQEQARGQLMA